MTSDRARPAAPGASSARRPAGPRARAAAPTGAAEHPAPRSESTDARPRSAPRRRTGPTGTTRGSGRSGSSRPGGPSGPGRHAPPRNRIEPATARGSWFTAFSWRAAVLVGVIVLAAAVVLPSLRAYFRQQEELADLRAEADAAAIEVEDLRAEVARWDDPAFVVAQARERLAFVFPGETPYRVIDPESVEGAVEGSPAAEQAAEIEPEGTWYTRLWESVDAAGTAAVGEGPAGEGIDAPPATAGEADPTASSTPAD